MREGLEATNLNCKFSCTVSGLTRRSYNKEIHIFNIYPMKPYSTHPGCKEVIFTACHSGQLKLAYNSPKVISTSPVTFLWADLISQIFCTLNSSKKFTCPLGKFKNRIHQPNSKVHQPRAIGYYFLCTLA